jgi:hypothetical protein
MRHLPAPLPPGREAGGADREARREIARRRRLASSSAACFTVATLTCSMAAACSCVNSSIELFNGWPPLGACFANGRWISTYRCFL